MTETLSKSKIVRLETDIIDACLTNNLGMKIETINSISVNKKIKIIVDLLVSQSIELQELRPLKPETRF